MKIPLSIVATLMVLVIPSWTNAWSDDERSYPSNDVDEIDIDVPTSLFQLQLYHPWTDDHFLTDHTVESISKITEDVLKEVLIDHFDGAYLSLPSAASQAVQIGQFRTIEVDALGTEEFGFVGLGSNGVEDAQKCPCSTILLTSTAYFTLSRVISPAIGVRGVEETDDEVIFRVFLDDLILSLLRSTSPGGIALESQLQTTIAFFSEGQGFAARIIEPIDNDTEGQVPSSIKNSASPILAPTAAPSRSEAMQAPPLRSSHAPTPFSNLADGAISSSAPPARSGNRAILLVGASLGTCFFAAAFLLLHRAKSRRSTEEQYTSSKTNDGIEEIEFYPNHLRRTPSSYTSTYTQSDNKPPLVPGCMSMELSPNYFSNEPMHKVYNDTTPKSSNKASKESRQVKYNILSPPSRIFDISQRDIFEVKSLDDLDPLQPPSFADMSQHSSKDTQFRVCRELQFNSTSFSLFDSVWSSFDGWSTCSSRPSVESSAFLKPKTANVATLAPVEGTGGLVASTKSLRNVPGAGAIQATEIKAPTRLEDAKPDPPALPQVIASNDDGSFHGSVESFDSLISSCWDPNDNSTGDAIPDRAGAPTLESSSTTSAMADDVSFYPHLQFMSNPKMLRWAERARKSLAATSTVKVSSGISVEPKGTSAVEQVAAKENSAGAHPYLSVSFSNSTESSFDGNGFKIVNNFSAVV